MDFEIPVMNARDFSSSSWNCQILSIFASWISLDVNALEGLMHLDVLECYISNAGILIVWRDRTNRHTCAPFNVDVTDDNVLRTFIKRVTKISTLNHDSVIVICDVHSFNDKISNFCVDAIRVEAKPRQLNQAKEFSPWVHNDLKVMKPYISAVGELHVGVWRVQNVDASPFALVAFVESHQFRSRWVHIERELEPPNPSLTIDLSGALESEIGGVCMVDHVIVVFGVVFNV